MDEIKGNKSVIFLILLLVWSWVIFINFYMNKNKDKEHATPPAPSPTATATVEQSSQPAKVEGNLPVIEKIEPNSGKNTADTNVFIYGRNLEKAISAKIDGRNLKEFHWDTGKSAIKATIQSGLQPGNYDVVISTKEGISPVDAKSKFAYIDGCGYIEHGMMRVLDAFYFLTIKLGHKEGSYGIAIILLAVVIKLLLYYPTHMQIKSMKDMQAVQPEIKKLQEKYKDDPKRAQVEQWEFFKKHKINPFTGCLMLFIQFPILFGIWKTITAYKFKFEAAGFLWICPALGEKYPQIFGSNLATPDVPLLVLYGISMFLNQKLTVMDPSAAKNQAFMNTFMPVMFTFMMWMWKIPSALILYWLVFNVLSLIQQSMIMKQPSKVLESLAAEEAGKPVKSEKKKKK